MGRKKQINARVPDNLHGIILERATLIEETQGGYLSLIAQWWFAQGQPAVNDYEARLLAQHKQPDGAKFQLARVQREDAGRNGSSTSSRDCASTEPL